jgi:hypothetical protein
MATGRRAELLKAVELSRGLREVEGGILAAV